MRNFEWIEFSTRNENQRRFTKTMKIFRIFIKQMTHRKSFVLRSTFVEIINHNFPPLSVLLLMVSENFRFSGREENFQFHFLLIYFSFLTYMCTTIIFFSMVNCKLRSVERRMCVKVGGGDTIKQNIWE